MDYSKFNIKFINEDEFLLYLDWLTRFKNPINNLIRVCEKIIIKNLTTPKYNTKKIEEMSFFEKIYLAKFIWNKSLEKLISTKNTSQNKLKNFIIYEETQIYNTNNLIEQIKSLEFEKENFDTNYETLREDTFLPIDELVEYFKKSDKRTTFLEILIEKQNSKLSNEELYRTKKSFASIKALFIVEGITEETIMPEFAQISDMDFSTNGIKLKAAGGKTNLLKYYADIRKLLKIPIFILLDADGVDIIDSLKQILEPKDQVYIISKGEIEDILPHQLIIRAINSFYSMQGSITESDLSSEEPMTKTLYNLYKEKGFGEFHKAKFAQIIKENINSKEDTIGEIGKILEYLNNCTSQSI